MTTLFGSKIAQNGAHGVSNQLTHLVEHISNVVNGSQIASASVARAAISTESLRDEEVRSLQSSVENLSTSLEAISHTLGLESIMQASQINAATVAGLVAADANAFFANRVKPAVSTENMQVVQYSGADGFDARPLALEAYDERDNRNAAVFSIAYNMQASRQDEFGETLFPTIVVTPDQVGLSVTVRLMTVYNELYRQISGAIDQYAKKNIIRAIADPTILKNEMTRIIPVHRAESTDKFVDGAIVAPRTISLEGEDIVTAPLAVGKKLSLLGISQTDALLQSGVMDVTDSIEPSIQLQYVYVQVGTDVLKFDCSNLPLSEFVAATQNNYRVMQLNFETSSVLLNKDTINADGSALDAAGPLASLAANDLIVRLSLNLSGSVNIELGDTQVFGNMVDVFSVQNNAGETVSLSAAPANALVAAFAAAKVVGYELIAYRSNLNRRQRGQLIDTTYYTQVYNIMFRSPISAIHPVTMDGQTDASDLQALVTATRIRTSNAAVRALMDAANTLREYVDARDYVGVGPDTLGMGRFFVRPTYFEETVDMNDIVDSVKSHERAADIQAALVNKIRDYAYRMYRDSEYKAAADALAGGVAPVPTVIVATDPVLARYLTVTGDLRTLGGEFNVRVVSTLDRRVAGKIFLTFGVFDESRNTAPNPLNFGNMGWSPELTVVLPISRNGQISKELSVAPRFRHIINLPCLSVLQVTNVPDVTNKVALHFKTV